MSMSASESENNSGDRSPAVVLQPSNPKAAVETWGGTDAKTGTRMKLPKRELHTVHEVAARWGYTIADVAGWSAAGHFDILTGISPAMCGDKIIAGEVIIAAFDILPMFRRRGTPPTRLARTGVGFGPCSLRAPGCWAWACAAAPCPRRSLSEALRPPIS